MLTADQHQVHEPFDIGVLTVIGPELDAALKSLALTTRKKDEKTGTIFWTGTVHSQLMKRDYRIVLACVGDAGNPNAAAATTELLANYAPRALLLMGIAAGMRGKVKIGNVALSDRVAAYEPAALVKAADGTDRVESRPEIDRIPHRIEQDVVHYRPEQSRLAEIFRNIGGEFPAPRPEQEDFTLHVASTIYTQRSTISAGEKLLRNPDKIHELREIHGKIEVIEMEAAGFVDACRRYNALWLVVRGISDFGDQFKDDRFHTFASKAAAAVLADFIAHGLDLGPASAPPGWEASKSVLVKALLALLVTALLALLVTALLALIGIRPFVRSGSTAGPMPAPTTSAATTPPAAPQPSLVEAPAPSSTPNASTTPTTRPSGSAPKPRACGGEARCQNRRCDLSGPSFPAVGGTVTVELPTMGHATYQCDVDPNGSSGGVCGLRGSAPSDRIKGTWSSRSCGP